MIKEEIERRIQIGMDLYNSQGADVYTDENLKAHMLDLVRDSTADHKQFMIDFKKVMEAFIDKVEEVRDKQRKYWKGSKDLLGQCMNLESELDRIIITVKEQHKLNTDYLKKSPPAKQGKLL